LCSLTVFSPPLSPPSIFDLLSFPSVFFPYVSPSMSLLPSLSLHVSPLCLYSLSVPYISFFCLILFLPPVSPST
jgi:hypothetical protein